MAVSGVSIGGLGSGFLGSSATFLGAKLMCPVVGGGGGFSVLLLLLFCFIGKSLRPPGNRDRDLVFPMDSILLGEVVVVVTAGFSAAAVSLDDGKLAAGAVFPLSAGAIGDGVGLDFIKGSIRFV